MPTATWSWRREGGALTTVADKHLGLVDAETIDWSSLGASVMAAGERERRRRAWIVRGHDEYRSMVAFAELLQELTELAAPVDVVGAAARIVRDETRHVALCARVVDALGGLGDPRAAGEPSWVRSDRGRPVRDRVAMTMIASLCIGETISAAMIADAREKETDAALCAVTTLILADEAIHGRIGFAWADATWRGLPLSTRLYVESSLPTVFEALTDQQQTEERRVLFEQTMSDIVLPRLDAVGVRAARAWDGRRR